MSEPRSKVIIRRTVEAINSTNLNVLKFAARVAEAYLRMVAPTDRTVDFHDATGSMNSLLRAEKANGCIVDRYIKGVVRFPADLEEAWIGALPEPHGANLVRELAARYGLSGAKLPSSSTVGHIVGLADVLSDAAQVARMLAPACANGSITAADAPHVARSLAEIDRSIADLLTLKTQLTRAIGDSLLCVQVP